MSRLTSSRAIRQILGERFGIPAHMVKEDHIKILMSYCTFQDLRRLNEEDMEAFLAEGKANGLFFSTPAE